MRRELTQTGGGLRRALAPIGLGLLLLIVFTSTLHPGVVDGDSAEFQHMSPLLGICHPPGYPIQVVAGYCFSLIPIGSVAYRVTLMLAVCGVAGVLALFLTLRRITKNEFAAWIASGLLAFSAVFWSQAIVPEAYVFYGMFLLWSLYFATRFLQGGPAWTFYAAALAYGVCVANRPSEAFVFPAFAAAWWAHRRTAPISFTRLSTGAVAALLPLAFSLGYYVLRENPALLHARDDALRDQILNEEPPFPSLPFFEKVRSATLYCAGLKWANEAKFSRERFIWDVDKLIWALSGRGALADRFDPNDRDRRIGVKAIEQGRGASMGLPGLALAALAFFCGRGRWAWVGCGSLLIAGNLFFYFYHHPPDNLDFILPATTGLALLAGVGLAGLAERLPARFSGAIVLGAAGPIFLLVGNYEKLNRATPEEVARQGWLEQLGEAELPKGAVILSRYEMANALRYVYYIAHQRADVQPLIFRNRYGAQQLDTLVRGLRSEGKEIFLTPDVAGLLPAQQRRSLAARTAPQLEKLGLLRLTP